MKSVELKSLFNKKPRYSVHNKQQCKGGCSDRRPRWHHSIEESAYCNKLLLLKKAGEIRSYKTQVRYDLHDRLGTRCGWMIVDFVVVHADGKIKIHEYKGKFFGTLMEYKTKKALFSFCYPKLEYVTVMKNQLVI